MINHIISYAEGQNHTNTIENAFSLLERGVYGTFHKDIFQKFIRRSSFPLCRSWIRYGCLRQAGPTRMTVSPLAMSRLKPRPTTQRRKGEERFLGPARNDNARWALWREI
jgi:hypothetical protein